MMKMRKCLIAWTNIRRKDKKPLNNIQLSQSKIRRKEMGGKTHRQREVQS